MRKNNVLTRLLSVFLVLCIVAAWVLPSAARAAGIKFTQVSNDRVSADLFNKDAVHLNGNQPEYAPTDVVRVSIFLDKAGVIDAGYSVNGLAQNDAAMAYRDKLAKEQTSVINKIEKAIEEKLDVVWNLTLATNLISANVQFGQIASIEKIKGVRNVVIETEYEPDVVESAPADPNMATSSAQTGTAGSYAAGYTGAGSRIAIIDTGLDIDHQSFNPTAFAYSLSNQAGKASMTPESYVESLDLLDAEEIAAVLSKLNVLDRAGVSAEEMYINAKIPFGFNYIDGNTNVTHLYDSQGEHGSHVAGIATANSYIFNADGTFSNALDTVHVQGVAPDAQIIVMKVFGEGGGAYPADYMAAIEDAVLLGADSINLSLGSGNPGMSSDANAEFQAIFNSLEKSGVVVSISAGNAGAWMDASETGIPYMYLDDVSMQTGGSPGSYTNSLGVASVDNAGYVGNYITVNGTMVSYTETNEYGNAPFVTLAGTQEYVFLNGIGTPEQFAALGEGALEGKIAMCYRGETSFFEKANAAVAAGAIGVIIVNNQTGMLYLNLTGYEYTAPVVCASLTDGEFFKGTAITDSEGNVLGWTGTMDVAASAGVGLYNEPYYTMSSFSSWGVPGSLIMKPEITAPGGNILSVAGANAAYGITDHVSYELMSGTSMAAPQVAGMSALIAQYIRENDLTTKTGLDARTLAQSLLMSTAVPMQDGQNGGLYYPVLQQGSGLANVGAAIMADSYILMNADATASYADGKVKVELGDDPEKKGVYIFSFTINNMTDADDTYALYADFFTQSAFAYSNILFLDTMTKMLFPAVAFTVDGKEIEGGIEMFGMDFNADGKVNAADGQLLLDYATGITAEIANAAIADIDADGNVNSYDAYLFFKMLGQSGAVVPANGSATVEVTVTLGDYDKAWLSNYENGAYLEGYVYAQSVADAEGVEGTCHSIPVLGFYGNWSDASMFDKGSYEDYYLSGEENRSPYLYGTNFAQNDMNGLFITYGDDPANEYYFGGNPIVPDDVYMPERNAISAANGDMISTIGFTSIRNAADSYFQIFDLTNGQVLLNQSLGAVNSAYYHVNSEVWKNTYLTLNAGIVPNFVPEDTMLEMGITLIPEYYIDENGQVNWAALGDGVSLSMNMTVDNTAPVLNDLSLSLIKNTLTVDVTDNQYVSAVALLDQYGEYVYLLEGSQADAQPNVACEYVLDLSEVNGSGFLLQVYDYAMNCTTYEINTQIGEVVDHVDEVVISEDNLVMQKNNTADLNAVVYPVNASNRNVVWSSSDETVATVDENGTVLAVSVGTAQIVATSALDNTIYAVCNVEVIDIAVDLNGIVWDEEGSIWFSKFNTAKLPDYTKLSGDMLNVDYMAAATMAPDGTLYASSLNTSNNSGALYTIDPVTYEATKLSDCIVQGLHIFYSDLTYVPAMFGTGALLGAYGPFIIAIDPATGTAMGIIDQYSSDVVGITTCYGQFDPDMGVYQDVVYVILNDGTVIQEIYYGYDGVVVPYMDYFYGERAAFDSGVDVGSAWYFNSAYYDGTYLYWSAFDEATENAVTLYAIDADYTGSVYNMGQFGEGVWPIAGLYQDFVNTVSDDDIQKLNDLKAEAASKAIKPETYEIEKIEIVKEKLSGAELPKLPMNGIDVGEGEDFITVNITAQDATGTNVPSTNGVVTVTFNSAALTLKSVNVNGDYTSLVEADGSVTFGYVKLDGFAADDVIATLVFDVRDTDVSGVTVIYKEINDTNPDASVDVDVEFPHTNTEIRDAKAPTCTTAGYTGDTYCTDCGKLIAKGEIIEATGHSFGEWTETKAPTCTEAGEETRTCACGEVETRPVAATGHSYNAVVTAPTCTEKGYTTYTCACGDSYVADYVDATGHSFGEWTETKAPTCTEEGSKTRTCACGETETEVIPATGHKCESVVTAPTCTEKGYTTHTCACGYVYVDTFVDATGHTFGEWVVTTAPTCTEAGVETRTCHCGATETQEVAATGHTYESVVTAPTCTEKGFTTHTCACGDSYVDSEVEATGHSFGEWVVTTAPTCTEAGVETRTCHCGATETQEVAATGHNYTSVVTDPTTEAEGYTTHTCENCGHSYVDSYTEKLPVKDPDNSQTGDSFMAHLWIMGMLGSVAALAALVIYRKRSFQA